MHRPSIPRCNLHSIFPLRKPPSAPSQPRHMPHKSLLYRLPHHRMLHEEHIAHIVQSSSAAVSSVPRDREYLPVVLYSQLQLSLNLPSQSSHHRSQHLLALPKEHDVVGIFRALNPRLPLQSQLHSYLLSHPLVSPVHHVAQRQVCQVLAQVIANGHSLLVAVARRRPQRLALRVHVHRVDNLVNQS